MPSSANAAGDSNSTSKAASSELRRMEDPFR